MYFSTITGEEFWEYLDDDVSTVGQYQKYIFNFFLSIT